MTYHRHRPWPPVGASVRPLVRPLVRSAAVRPPSARSSVRPHIRRSARPPAHPRAHPSARPSASPIARSSVRPLVRPSVRSLVRPIAHKVDGTCESCCSHFLLSSIQSNPYACSLPNIAFRSLPNGVFKAPPARERRASQLYDPGIPIHTLHICSKSFIGLAQDTFPPHCSNHVCHPR